MSSAAQKIEIPNTLRDKVGGSPPVADAQMIAMAEAALQGLSGNFAEWLRDEVEKLEEARLQVTQEGVSAETMEHVYIRAHDLKGLGATYEFPLVTRIAASLCKMIDSPATRQDAPLFLIDAHIDAIKAAVRGNVKTDEHPVGRVLAEELESRVRAFVV
ncbi:MAG: Hpt protein [Caulobacteraceae bacterium]|nr:Hpt protein [Caulobacteraceae bacterium]